MTTDSTNIPLNLLSAWKGNVRKTQSKTGIEELAASIKAHGQQQNLVVMRDGKRFLVVAGKRRLMALQLLVKSGDLSASHKVPCRICGPDEAAEISLAENVIREDMHPADQFDAFRALADKGVPVTDIAARFGKTEAHVTRLLKLARVSRDVLTAYRAQELTLEEVMAFAVSDDHEAQERVLGDLKTWHDAGHIRAALTEGDIPATDKRVKFVTLKAYEAAGGRTLRDLFSDGGSGIYILDVELLERLVAERLEKKAKPVRAEGWKWVEACPDFGYQESGRYRRIHAAPPPLTACDAMQLAVLEEERHSLANAFEASGEEEPPERLLELDRIINGVEDREGVWTPEQLALAGAVVTIDHQGKPRIERGFVRPEDMPKKPGKQDKAPASGDDEGDTQTDNLSASLVESLTAERSAALAAALLDAPDKGLALVVYAMALRIFGDGDDAVVKIAALPQSLHRVEGSKAFQRIEEARETWGQRVPGNPADIWQWCLAQDQGVLTDLLTFCAACTVNAVQTKADRPDCPRLAHADQLAASLALDMAAWFTPDAGSYFTRVSKAQVLVALQEARQQPIAPAWEKMKKPELAALAEREIAGTGWLPHPLRAA